MPDRNWNGNGFLSDVNLYKLTTPAGTIWVPAPRDAWATTADAWRVGRPEHYFARYQSSGGPRYVNAANDTESDEARRLLRQLWWELNKRSGSTSAYRFNFVHSRNRSGDYVSVFDPAAADAPNLNLIVEGIIAAAEGRTLADRAGIATDTRVLDAARQTYGREAARRAAAVELPWHQRALLWAQQNRDSLVLGGLGLAAAEVARRILR